MGIKYKDKLHIILGFTAGVLLGVVAFNIFPEIVQLAINTKTDITSPMTALVIGFLLFHILEKLLLIHHAEEETYGKHKHPTVGAISALALAGHSFLDGVGIGLGFQISPAIGLAVAIAVIAHDFSDGLNTVSLALVHKNTTKKTLLLLAIDALAPILGVISTRFYTLSENVLLLYLGFFAGFLLYIGIADILPQAHNEKSSMLTILSTVFGASLIFGISRLLF